MTATDQVRLRVDASKCDGQGVCNLLAPEWFELDRYGYAYLREEVVVDRADAEVWELAREAEATCPRAAILLQRIAPLVTPVLPERSAPFASSLGTAGADRLCLADLAAESLQAWRDRGGLQRRPSGQLRAEVDAAGICGHGGAGFPVSAKWGTVSEGAFLVVNGAEREPGTVKDAYLLERRPFLVLDGAVAAAHDRGIDRIVVAIPVGEPEIRLVLERARDELLEAGLLAGKELRVLEVPPAYVAGEETALLSAIGGAPPKPRLRPPFPSLRGLENKPTLVHNVETISHVALVNAYGADWYRQAGTEASPGTGLFSVGRYGASVTLHEVPFGTALGELLERASCDAGAAVLVGGYSGGLLRPDQTDVPLDPASLAAVGARLGTKSVQVVETGECVLRAVISVLRYFAAETAQQCPPCERGLPDMADLLSRLEAGQGDEALLADMRSFLSVLPGRGLCALPDGAASIVLSYLANFATDVERHLASGCPVST